MRCWSRMPAFILSRLPSSSLWLAIVGPAHVRLPVRAVAQVPAHRRSDREHTRLRAPGIRGGARPGRSLRHTRPAARRHAARRGAQPVGRDRPELSAQPRFVERRPGMQCPGQLHRGDRGYVVGQGGVRPGRLAAALAGAAHHPGAHRRCRPGAGGTVAAHPGPARNHSVRQRRPARALGRADTAAVCAGPFHPHRSRHGCQRPDRGGLAAALHAQGRWQRADRVAAGAGPGGWRWAWRSSRS